MLAGEIPMQLLQNPLAHVESATSSSLAEASLKVSPDNCCKCCSVARFARRLLCHCGEWWDIPHGADHGMIGCKGFDTIGVS